MDFCEHMNAYNLAMEYFPKCFDDHLQLKNNNKLYETIEKCMNSLRRKENANYKEILYAHKYIIDTLSKTNEAFSDIRSIDIKALYLRYEDTLYYGSKKGEGYNYLLLLTIAKKPIIEIFRSIDARIKWISNDQKAKEIEDFISKWNQLLSTENKEYNYINLSIFINELNEVSKDDPILMGYNNILSDILIQINHNPNILRKRK